MKKSLKRILTTFFAFTISILILFLLSPYFDELQKTDTREIVIEEPLAVFSHVEPTDDKYINRKGKLRMTYKYGQLLIPKSNLGIYRVHADNKRVFVDYYAYWPDFAILERKIYNPDDRINIMFEIYLSDLAFRDVYLLKERYQEKGKMLDTEPTGFDFPGLEGYRHFTYAWFYVAVNPRVTTPQGTPLTISCSTVSEGRCRFNLIFDKHLRAQIRFNMYLLKDWQKFYNKVIMLINQFRQQNTKGEIQ